MIDHTLMAQLWTSVRSAVQEFRVTRMQRKSDSRFRVIVRRKCSRQKSTSRGFAISRLRLSSRYRDLKRALSRSRVNLAAASAGKFKGETHWDFISGEELDEEEEDEEGEEEGDEEVVEDEDEEAKSLAIKWRSWQEMDIGECVSRGDDREREVTAMPWSNRWEDLGSPDWESTILTSSSSTRPAGLAGDRSASGRFHRHRWGNRDWRLSYRSPQLVQPVRGKLTALSTLMKTMSDRYARRTGDLTPLHERASKQPFLPHSISSSPCIPRRTTSSVAPRTVEVVVTRYDNPFQDYLRQSFVERNSKFAQNHSFDNSGSKLEPVGLVSIT